MIVIGTKVFMIIPFSDPIATAMRGDNWGRDPKVGIPFNGGDPEHIELAYLDTKMIIPKGHSMQPLTTYWRAGLKMIESMYGNAAWVCPD